MYIPCQALAAEFLVGGQQTRSRLVHGHAVRRGPALGVAERARPQRTGDWGLVLSVGLYGKERVGLAGQGMDTVVKRPPAQ